jgi:hypothetical protein
MEPMKAFADLSQEALQRTPQERLHLARMLIEATDFDQIEYADAEEAWDLEIARRAAMVSEGSCNSRPLPEVLSELQAKYKA